jgi:hypothetical protein
VLCVTIQGAKRSIFGDKFFDYPAGKALIVSCEMPAFSKIVKASPSAPFLGIEARPLMLTEAMNVETARLQSRI